MQPSSHTMTPSRQTPSTSPLIFPQIMSIFCSELHLPLIPLIPNVSYLNHQYQQKSLSSKAIHNIRQQTSTLQVLQLYFLFHSQVLVHFSSFTTMTINQSSAISKMEPFTALTVQQFFKNQACVPMNTCYAANPWTSPNYPSQLWRHPNPVYHVTDDPKTIPLSLATRFIQVITTSKTWIFRSLPLLGPPTSGKCPLQSFPSNHTQSFFLPLATAQSY